MYTTLCDGSRVYKKKFSLNNIKARNRPVFACTFLQCQQNCWSWCVKFGSANSCSLLSVRPDDQHPKLSGPLPVPFLFCASQPSRLGYNLQKTKLFSNFWLGEELTCIHTIIPPEQTNSFLSGGRTPTQNPTKLSPSLKVGCKSGPILEVKEKWKLSKNKTVCKTMQKHWQRHNGPRNWLRDLD